MLTLTVALLAALYAGAVVASLTTLAQSPSFERTVTINHAPKTLIQAKVEVPFYLAHLPSAIEEKVIQYDILHHYHV
jgi:acyl-CoA synthetase (AMP-forming)/AMP-acid ligase II